MTSQRMCIYVYVREQNIKLGMFVTDERIQINTIYPVEGFFAFMLRSSIPYKRYSSTYVPPSVSKHLSISFCRVIKFSKPQHEEHFPGWIVKSQSWVIMRCRVRCSPTRYVILAVGAGRRCADDDEIEAFEEDSWK